MGVTSEATPKRCFHYESTEHLIKDCPAEEITSAEAIAGKGAAEGKAVKISAQA